MIPDAQRIVSDHLREHSAVVDLDLGVRVVASPPKKTDTPWIRVTQLADPAVGGHRSDHLIAFMFQLDIYAGATGGLPEASSVNIAARAALVDMPGVHGSAVVTGVDPGGAVRLQDPDVDEPARERYVRTITVWAHS